MDIDLRPLLVLGPLALVIFWVFINMKKAVVNGEATLFGKRGNNPFK
jgi:photosystem II PsbY protein